MSEMPKFVFQLGGAAEQEVLVPNGVQVKWELERSRKNWPDSSDAPNLWASFLVWATAKRDGLIESNMPFEAFTDQLDVLRFEDPQEAKPTRRARGRGSSSS